MTAAALSAAAVIGALLCGVVGGALGALAAIAYCEGDE